MPCLTILEQLSTKQDCMQLADLRQDQRCATREEGKGSEAKEGDVHHHADPPGN